MAKTKPDKLIYAGSMPMSFFGLNKTSPCMLLLFFSYKTCLGPFQIDSDSNDSAIEKYLAREYYAGLCRWVLLS